MSLRRQQLQSVCGIGYCGRCRKQGNDLLAAIKTKEELYPNIISDVKLLFAAGAKEGFAVLRYPIAQS